MKDTDILIIGGGPAGMVAASTSRQYYAEKKITLIKSKDKSLVPCGIPYIFGPMLDGVEDDMVPCGPRAEKMGLDLIIDTVDSIDLENKTIHCAGGESVRYDKLIMATGSIPRRPVEIGNIDAKGVFTVPKDAEYIQKVYDGVKDKETLCVIGTGFIGVEIAGELAKTGKQVHLVGSRLLKHAFDPEFSDDMETIMLHDNITFHKNRRAVSVKTDSEGRAAGIVLKDGEEIDSDAVILAAGYEPNTELARQAGLSMRERNTIYVDEYMRTTQPDVFAIGDCAEKRHFLTKRGVPIMLASTATAEARVAAANLYKINVVKSFSGTIDIFSTVIEKTCFASVGITQEDAEKQNIAAISSTVVVDDKHPAKLPGSEKQTVKIVAMQSSGIVIGAQVIGAIDVGEMVNILGVIIEKKMSVYDLLNLQVATHPLLTSAPTNYPIVQAAQNIAMRTISC